MLTFASIYMHNDDEMLISALIILYVHVIIFHYESNDDDLDVIKLYYLIMYHGHQPTNVDTYSLNEHCMLDGMYGTYG